MELKENNRILGIDIVRTVAVLFVFCVHFFLHTGFYQGAMIGKRMFLMTGMRWLFFTCVPLFLVLTGYLNRKKRLDLKNYWRLGDILLSYLFISVVIILFKVFYLKQELPLIEWILKIFNYTAANYAWYVEMYIGLFLFLPFLNLIFNGLNTRRQKEILLLVMIFMTSAFSLTNLAYKILPDFWFSLYPVTYYFIGAYIAEYQIKLDKKKAIALLGFFLLIETAAAFYFSKGTQFRAGSLDTWGAFPNTAVTALIFLILYNIDIKNKMVRWFVSDVSKLSFDMYLISFVFDTIIYEAMRPHFPDAYSMLPYFIPCVFFVFIGSYLFSFVKRALFQGVGKLFIKETDKNTSI